jgi:hypothetical protein
MQDEDLIVLQEWQLSGCKVMLVAQQADLDVARELDQAMNAVAMLRIVKLPEGDA